MIRRDNLEKEQEKLRPLLSQSKYVTGNILLYKMTFLAMIDIVVEICFLSSQ